MLIQKNIEYLATDTTTKNLSDTNRSTSDVKGYNTNLSGLPFVKSPEFLIDYLPYVDAICDQPNSRTRI